MLVRMQVRNQLTVQKWDPAVSLGAPKPQYGTGFSSHSLVFDLLLPVFVSPLSCFLYWTSNSYGGPVKACRLLLLLTPTTSLYFIYSIYILLYPGAYSLYSSIYTNSLTSLQNST